jgi:Family of unknown function (DUF6454)
MAGLLTLFLSVVLWSQQAAAPAVSGVEGARLADVQMLEGTLYHVQGIALDKEHIWVTSVDAANKRGYVHQFNRATRKFERQVDVTEGALFHPGGLSVSGDSIWVPVAEYRPNSSAVLVELDKRTLAVKRRIAVADHLGCVAVTTDGLIAGNWSSRRLYVFDREGRQTRVIDNPSANQYQDIKFVDGMLVASGNLTKTTGAVDWYAWPSMKLVRSVQVGVSDKGRIYTAEGMAVEGNNLYLLPEDGPSRLFHFVLEEGTR